MAARTTTKVPNNHINGLAIALCHTLTRVTDNRTGQHRRIPLNGFLVLLTMGTSDLQAIGKIAKVTKMSIPSVSGSMRQLKDRGYVRCTEHPTDGRCTNYILTAKGRRYVVRISDSMAREMAKVARKSAGMKVAGHTDGHDHGRFQEGRGHDASKIRKVA